VHFVNLKDAGDPVECARIYCENGADELAFLDITATIEKRKTTLEAVRRVARVITIPFTVGGGISSVADAEEVLEAGANRVSISSAAFRNPAFIDQSAAKFGSSKLVVAIDVDQNPALPSGYEVYIDGGRTPTGKDAIE
jgi:cyclase